MARSSPSADCQKTPRVMGEHTTPPPPNRSRSRPRGHVTHLRVVHVGLLPRADAAVDRLTETAVDQFEEDEARPRVHALRRPNRGGGSGFPRVCPESPMLWGSGLACPPHPPSDPTWVINKRRKQNKHKLRKNKEKTRHCFGESESAARAKPDQWPSGSQRSVKKKELLRSKASIRPLAFVLRTDLAPSSFKAEIKSMSLMLKGGISSQRTEDHGPRPLRRPPPTPAPSWPARSCPRRASPPGRGGP